MEPSQRVVTRSWFDWVAMGLAVMMLGGGYLDSWAHNHFRLETFLTPWHGVLYASLLATAAFLVLVAASTGAPPWAWHRALPEGYGLSLAGVVLFGVAGVLDLAWHTVFGIERSFAQLISPTHLLLMLAGGLIAAGPLRAAWCRPQRRPGYPAVLAAAVVFSVLTYFGQFDHPLVTLWAGTDLIPGQPWAGEELGVLGVIMQTAALMAITLSLVARFQLPIGSMTLILGLDSVAMTMIKGADPVMLTGIAAGVAADGLLLLLQPSLTRPHHFRAFASLVPLVTYTIYFAWLLGTTGIWWPVHVWVGAIAIASITGWLVSLVVLPQPSPTLEETTR